MRGSTPRFYDFGALDRLPVQGSAALASPVDRRCAPHDKPKDFQPVGRWRKAWSSHKKRHFKAIAGRTLIQAGYAKDDH